MERSAANTSAIKSLLKSKGLFKGDKKQTKLKKTISLGNITNVSAGVPRPTTLAEEDSDFIINIPTSLWNENSKSKNITQISNKSDSNSPNENKIEVRNNLKKSDDTSTKKPNLKRSISTQDTFSNNIKIPKLMENCKVPTRISPNINLKKESPKFSKPLQFEQIERKPYISPKQDFKTGNLPKLSEKLLFSPKRDSKNLSISKLSEKLHFSPKRDSKNLSISKLSEKLHSGMIERNSHEWKNESRKDKERKPYLLSQKKVIPEVKNAFEEEEESDDDFIINIPQDQWKPPTQNGTTEMSDSDTDDEFIINIPQEYYQPDGQVSESKLVTTASNCYSDVDGKDDDDDDDDFLIEIPSFTLDNILKNPQRCYQIEDSEEDHSLDFNVPLTGFNMFCQ